MEISGEFRNSDTPDKEILSRTLRELTGKDIDEFVAETEVWAKNVKEVKPGVWALPEETGETDISPEVGSWLDKVIKRRETDIPDK